MYKFLLCWRYLCTRYIALASITSVTLGVATMIVVNSVMSGFSHEMHTRLHGILSDIVLESISAEGAGDPEALTQQIRDTIGDQVEGLTAVVHVPAMLSFQHRGEWVTRHVNLIGIDANTHAEVSDFGKFLLHPENRRQLDFLLKDGGYDTIDHQSGSQVQERRQLRNVGWPYRRFRVQSEREYQRLLDESAGPQIDAPPSQLSRLADSQSEDTRQLTTAVDEIPDNPYVRDTPLPEDQFDALTQQHAGAVLGIAMVSTRRKNADKEVEDYFLCLPGDDVNISFPTAGTPPKLATGKFTVVDFYESKMNEYDTSFVFVPLSHLQELRRMIDPLTGVTAVTSIQIKLKKGSDLLAACESLRNRFPPHQYPYRIQTWKEMQGPLLSAVQMETTILNILLFLIIAVAGFGILATFFMIVVEKTRDIGVLKSLGAPRNGVMSIFLSYGVSLGLVGSSVGMILGLLFVIYINQIADGLEWITGTEVFDPTVYYFDKIPTIIHPLTIGWIVAGAVLIAVLASVLPALRAARLHPVEALRYE